MSYFVISKDAFMSGWCRADGLENICAVMCVDKSEVDLNTGTRIALLEKRCNEQHVIKRLIEI